MNWRDGSMDPLIEQIIRLGIERNAARQERDKLQGEVYPLRGRVASLELKYEPKPEAVTYWGEICRECHRSKLKCECSPDRDTGSL